MRWIWVILWLLPAGAAPLVVTVNGAPHGDVDPANASAALQAALDAASAAGGGVVGLPAGELLLSTALQARDRTILRGAGMGVTVLRHGWGVRGLTGGGERAKPLDFVGVEDLTFRGPWDQRPHMGENSDRHIALEHVGHVWLHRVEGLYGGQMGFTAGYCQRVEVLHCRVIANARDGINLAGSRRTQVMFCEIRHCWDDAIAIHSNEWSGVPPAGEHQIAFNQIEDSFGVKLLGGNRVQVAHNLVLRPKGYGLWVGGYQANYHEGNNDVYDVQITDNQVLDPINPSAFGSPQQINFGIYLAAPNPSLGTAPALAAPPGSFADGAWIRPEDTQLRSSRVGAPFSGGWRLQVSGNIVARTLPEVAAISQLGLRAPYNPEGRLFHADGWRDIALRDHLRSGSAITIRGAAHQVRVRDNEIDGWNDGLLFHSAARLRQVEVTGNRFHRLRRSAILVGKYPTEAAPEPRQMLLRIASNVFDLDPYLEHANRRPDGGWNGTPPATPQALDASLVHGAVLSDNTFRNLNTAVHGAADAQQVVLRGNRWYGQFSGVGDRDDNRGIRRLDPSAEDLVLAEGSDPSASDYGQPRGAPPVTAAAAPPRSGWYLAGQQVRCLAPQRREGQVLLGWLRLTTGDGHQPGQDWVELWATAR